MAIPIKSLDEMISEIKASLQAGEFSRPAYTLLVGSGFSFPVIPTPAEMLGGDIAWWRYCKSGKISGVFRSRAEGIADGSATQNEVDDFERDLWKEIHGWAATSDTTNFNLTAAGLPDLTDPRMTGHAYHAVMAKGLMSNKMRRQYLRDAIARSYPRVNGAHIFLASILEAQESWEWRAPFCRTIFTTNFDPLLQRSLQLVNKLYYMSDRPDVLEPPDDDESDAIHLVYTHGSVHRYDLLNTDEQIEQARKRNAPTLVDYFRRHGVIVIGYSGWADTTMEALMSCPAFDANLYWCDIHPAVEAETRLRHEVLKILEARGKSAFYVPISGADEAMRLLHRGLNLGPVPKFILAPVSTMIDQLKSIKVPLEPAVTAGTGITPLSPTLASLLEDTLTRLEVAKSAFDDPSIVRPSSSKEQEGVAKALVAQLLSDAFVAYSQGKRDQAISLLSTVIAIEGLPPTDRATALLNRGFTLTQSGETTKGMVDLETVIEMPHATADQKAYALYNRGFTWGKIGETAKAIADYTAVIEMPDAWIEGKAMALNNRGVAWGDIGETAKAIADFTAVIGMPDASVQQKAKALNNRGIAWGKIGETAKAIADHNTVIEMPDAPIEQRAEALNDRGVALGTSGETSKGIEDFAAVIEMSDTSIELRTRALFNRAVAWEKGNEITKAIADYTAVIEMFDGPPEQKAKALNNRGVARGEIGEAVKAIADFTALIEMPDAPVKIKVDAFNNRGRVLGQLGETTKELEDYTAVIEMPDALAEQTARALTNRGWSLFISRDDVHGMINDSKKAVEIEEGNLSARSNLALGLLLNGEVEAARAEYEELLSRTLNATSIREAVADLETALRKRPQIRDAQTILDHLKDSISHAGDAGIAPPPSRSER